MKLKRIHVRTLLKHSAQTLADHLQGHFILVFDDGVERQVHERDVIYSSYVWDIHRRWPETPLTKRHLGSEVIGLGHLPDAKTHFKLLNQARWDTYDAYKAKVADRQQLNDELNQLAYRITNNIYNYLVSTPEVEACVTSMDLLDFAECAEHPRIKAALLNIHPEPFPDEPDDLYRGRMNQRIFEVKKIVEDVVLNDPSLAHNPVAKAARAKVISMDQLGQILGLRGYLTDVDSTPFKRPIFRGFYHGLRSLADAMMESRSAAKSLAFSADPLKQSEYFSRRQQLLCQNVMRLWHCDCGSTHYLSWKVRDAYRVDHLKKVDEIGEEDDPTAERVEETARNCDLDTLQGKYYLDDFSTPERKLRPQLEVVKPGDRHLIGETLKIRSVVAGCMHPDPYGVCEVCYGETSLAIPANTNVGQMSVTRMTQDVSQIVLSTKHFEGSAVVEGISLKPTERAYLSARPNSSHYYLNPGLKGKSVYITFAQEEAPGLSDVRDQADVRALHVQRISEFEYISMTVTAARNKQSTVHLKVAVSKRLASFSHEMLEYLKKYPAEVTSDNRYMVDLQHWNFEEPLLVLPLRQFNMGDHQSEIASMLESTVAGMQEREKTVSPTAMLIQFHDLVNHPGRKLSINLGILDVVVYSVMVRSTDNHDYALPKPWTGGGLGVQKVLLANRSLSATMAYERHKVALSDPENFIYTERPDHIFDGILMPEEVYGPRYGRPRALM